VVLRRSWPGALLVCGGVLAGLYAVAAALREGPGASLSCAAAAGVAVALCETGAHGRRPDPLGVALSALVVELLVRWSSLSATLWQIPSRWGELSLLTPLGASLIIAGYLIATFVGLFTRGHGLGIRGGAAFVAAPPLFNLLLLLASPDMLRAVGTRLLPSAISPLIHAAPIGAALVLFAFDETVLLGVGLLMDGRWLRGPAAHLTILGGSVLAAFSPLMAEWGSSAQLAALPALLRPLSVAGLEAVAESALWAETFLVTGVLLEALRGLRPTSAGCLSQWKSGFVRGGVYGALFMVIVHVGALLSRADVIVGFLRANLPFGAAACGAVLFPFARTLVESFDGSDPFFARLGRAHRDTMSYLRGAIIGVGLGLGLRGGLPGKGEGLRFVFGCIVGALAYGGADLLLDVSAMVRGRRQCLQTWRVYALGALAGGFVGGAVSWYFDARQLAVVLDELERYATVNFASAGGRATELTVYPLFSKWGAIPLGPVGGGASLLYAQSLAGVINWAIAAPLFSANLVILTALFQRSVAPVKELFSARGLVDLVGQTVRVLRWGPWMAPIISSFLRMSPQPSWYNQDGLVRTIVAIWQSGTLSPRAFRAWSLDCFLGLLAYDWLRVLIWFDHMGLRVATLVNLSFVGADALDEKAARFVGHSARTRVIPAGIRRFLTWAPLLIPFYIPRGRDWDHAWNGAERLSRGPGAHVLPAVSTLMVGYAAAGVLSLLVMAAIFGARRLRGLHTAPRTAPPFAFRLSNGQYTLEMDPDGLGYAHVTSALWPGLDIDLTRRPDDPLQRRGKFFWVREIDDGGRPGSAWSVTPEPAGRAAVTPMMTQVGPGRLCIEHTRGDLRVHAEVTVAANDPVERWRVRLTNLRNEPRRVELTSYRELCVTGTETHRRTPAFAGMHVGTTFVRALGAIIAHNRLLHATRGSTGTDVAFHAVASVFGVHLAGYEDSRARFLGNGTLAAPAAFAGTEPRAPDDEGLLYTFDPVASLRLQVELGASATIEIRFVDGYATDPMSAARLICRHLRMPMPGEAELRTSLAKTRSLVDSPQPPAADPFSPDGREVSADPAAMRPWTHVLANELGQGAVVSADGEVFAFNGNAQKNAISPFTLEGLTTQVPGQVIYVVDPESGEVDSAGFAPLRRRDSQHEATFGPGYARFTQRRAAIELDETVFIPTDAPLQVRCLRIRNLTGVPRRLRVVTYVEIVLAETPVDSRGRLETRIDEGVLLFCNPENDFRKGWAFAATSLKRPETETCRARFFGAARDGAEALFVVRGRAAAPFEDDGRRCAAFRGQIDVPALGEATVVLVLGQADDGAEAVRLARHHCDPERAERAFALTQRWWDEQLSELSVETTRRDVDRLLNTWLPYQLLTSRLWARTGPEQRSGAFGFRDQLQDVLPLCFTGPDRARAQILLHAAQQFREGDAVKWWHPSFEGRTGMAVRTRASDPHLWLPYVVTRYVRATGEEGVLGEMVPFLEGRPVPHGEEGLMFVPRASRDRGTLYEHCRRAIEWSLARCGARGLPLLGSGDWNDGLDAPGMDGRGESVWMGFFLHGILRDFAPVAARIEGPEAARRYEAEAGRLRLALEPMWRDDGYVRATTDDGSELCFASALMAAWPALSGAVDLERAEEALETGLVHLERPGRVLLLSPPFDERSKPYPGRIADYPPGVRENGGQYSHGASWIVDAWMRCAEMADQAGDAARAARCRDRAFRVWLEVSPLTKTSPRYGLPPHQQPADVYDGQSYGGRGGWSWYTGAAARMLSAAYALLGIVVEDGVLKLAEHAFMPKGELELRHVTFRGRRVEKRQRQRARTGAPDGPAPPVRGRPGRRTRRPGARGSR